MIPQAGGNRGGHRHSQERAHHVEQRTTHRDGEQHNHRVQIHRLGLQHGGEDIAFKLLYHKDQDQHHQRGGGAIGHQCNQHRNRAGGHRAHDGNKAREEGYCGQDQRQWNPHQDESNADEQGVDKRDDRLGADKARQRIPNTGEQLRQMQTNRRSGVAAHPWQETIPIFQEEEREHQHDTQGHSHRTC